MAKLNVGDIFEIKTAKGKSFFQYVYSNTNVGELIRILPGLYQDNTPDLKEIVKSNELFYVHFPLKAAVKQKIVNFIGNYDIPKDFEIPKYMRSKKVDQKGNFICWQIINYETWVRESVIELSNDQKKLSPWGVWNDTLLAERLSEKWTPEKWV
jgi:hypothetical protein